MHMEHALLWLNPYLLAFFTGTGTSNHMIASVLRKEYQGYV